MGAAGDFESQVEHLARSIENVETGLRGEALESARALVRAVLDVHRTAVADLLAGLSSAGVDRSREVVRQRSVAWLLSLHDLNPESIADRAQEAVRDALDTSRPGASAELAGVEDGTVRVRLEGASPDAVARLRHDIERAVIRLAPEAVLEFDDPFEKKESKVTYLLPPERLVRRPAGGPR